MSQCLDSTGKPLVEEDTVLWRGDEYFLRTIGVGVSPEGINLIRVERPGDTGKTLREEVPETEVDKVE